MVKHHRIASSMWKPVQLTNASDVEGLAGIEVLNNYDVKTYFNAQNAQVFSTQVSPSKTKSEKRKSNSVIIDEPKAKKKKKDFKHCKKVKNLKKNKRKLSFVPVTNEDESTEEDSKEEEDSSVILTGMEAWHGLNIPPPVIKALREQGFTQPTEIQALSLPPAIFGQRDILGAAETGSGKTLAFGIPILYGIWLHKNKLLAEQKCEDDLKEGNVENEVSDQEEESNMEENEIGCVKVLDDIEFDDEIATKLPSSEPCRRLYALILTPTRELAIQVKNHLVAAAKYMDVKVAVVVGGMASQKQERILRKGPEIVVATPGRLWELIQEGNPHLSQVDDIRYLAIDETDRMLEKGHFQELQNLLERININENKKRKRQNFVFSATLTLVHEAPEYVKKKIGRKKPTRILPGQKLQSIISMLGITNPKIVDVTKVSGTAETLKEARIFCTLEEKDFYLFYFLQRHPGRTLIFCNSIGCVRRLAQLLSILKCKALPLHAEMAQRQRLKNLEKFRDDPLSVLLATDVAARGLDIPDVEHVIHYQVPRTSEVYVHRSGRTARAQKSGITVLLVEPSEMNYYTRLCRTLGRDEDLPEFPTLSSYMGSVKERVILAREIDRLELASRKTNAETGWIHKALKEMDMVLDDNELPKHADHEKVSKNKKLAAVRRKQLGVLLARPVFPQDSTFSSMFPMRGGDAIQVLESTVTETKKAKKRKPESVRVSTKIKRKKKRKMKKTKS